MTTALNAQAFGLRAAPGGGPVPAGRRRILFPGGGSSGAWLNFDFNVSSVQEHMYFNCMHWTGDAPTGFVAVSGTDSGNNTIYMSNASGDHYFRYRRHDSSSFIRTAGVTHFNGNPFLYSLSAEMGNGIIFRDGVQVSTINTAWTDYQMTYERWGENADNRIWVGGGMLHCTIRQILSSGSRAAFEDIIMEEYGVGQ